MKPTLGSQHSAVASATGMTGFPGQARLLTYYRGTLHYFGSSFHQRRKQLGLKEGDARKMV